MPIIILILLIVGIYLLYLLINKIWSENIKTNWELREKAEKWDHFQRHNTHPHMRKHFMEWAKPGMTKEEIELKTGELHVEESVMDAFCGVHKSCVVWETESNGRIDAYFRNGVLEDISEIKR